MRAQNSSGSDYHRKEGFAQVARWIAFDPDSESFIYRKFDELAARNLLYLQSELLVLEKQLDQTDKNDAESDDMGLADTIMTWETLERQYKNGNEEARIRMNLIVKMRDKLKEYHEALLLQSEIAKLKRPSKRVLTAYREWFNKPRPALGGLSKTFLDDPNDLEEISLDNRCSVGRYHEKSIAAATAIISILVAALLLVGSITGLYFVTSDASKLGMIAAFTALFALSVGLMTSAKRAEIFASTAAYAAVLVVFVSGSISSSTSLPTT
ncbi:uncharacterized protein TRIVIDRAFT_223886 [Trichoderma virens Gv29-8]|uniref:DUF6594 domain-containing protein n=1 Tax=Hypocrea virens (strain Gv29-8 / FGSC 10586) TaxID=413071 RepID=G9MYE7_HYPVG|nr:uncharacterized protein TRIVIDRAFT_223886 [Trichoderma virens Gv29-8]EHK20569.1 hypothetical protein TRIVIDRAFT_223886 [Trichoderma virens Gv29-8]